MKPYVCTLLELAREAHQKGRHDQALEHLADAARLARADEVDAVSGAQKLQAEHDKNALIRVVALVAPPEVRAEWLEAANPDGDSCDETFGPPSADAQKRMARGLGMHTDREFQNLCERLREAEKRAATPPLLREMGPDALTRMEVAVAKRNTIPTAENEGRPSDSGAADPRGVLEEAADGGADTETNSAGASANGSADAAGDCNPGHSGDLQQRAASSSAASQTPRPKDAKPKKTNGDVWKERGVHPGEQGTATEWLPKECA